MSKNILSIIFVFGILIFITSINFKFTDDNQSKDQASVFPDDTNRWHRSHDVYNDYRPNLVVPPFVINPRSKDNPLIFTNVNISNNSPAPHNEPSIKISHKNPNIVVAAWRDFRISYNPAFRRVGHSRSTDAGNTWSTSALIDSTLLGGGLLRNSDASVTVDTAGNFYITTIALNNSNGNTSLAIFKSTDGGVTFPIGHILAQGNGEDKEMVTTDLVPGSPFKNTIYISWSRLGLSNDINVIKSTDGGTTWSSPVAVSTGATYGQGSDPAVGINGELYITWVDVNTWGTQYFSKSTNGGATFSAPIVVANGPAANIPWSQSGPTTFPSIACDISGGPRNGYIYITWCDGRNGDADVFLSRSTDHGTTWSSPVRVNNDGLGNGKVQAWPWIGVSDSGKIAITFYDTRNTPNNNTIEAWLARSNDGGVTFTNEVLSSQQSPTARPNNDVRFGDYIGVDFWGSKIVPIWTDERAGGFDQEIYTAVVTNVIATHDIAVGPFLSLPGAFQINTPYAIKTRVFNNGTSNETGVPIKFYINGTLVNTTNINLNASQADSVSNTWTPAVAGSYTLKYISALSTDTIRTNDTVQTTVNVFASIPDLCEGFLSTTFPPTGWNILFTGTNYWTRSAVSGFCVGSGSAEMDFFDFTSGSQQMNTKSFNATGTGDSLVFQDAYATYTVENDQLQILTSTNAGTSWTPLITLNGGVSGELVTAPPTTSPFIPTCAQWKYQRFLLPPQTNKIQFNAITAYGNNLYLDSICLHKLIGITPIGNLIPTVYSLAQNYPNPFNPETKIQFALPKAGQVKIIVYDLLGAEVTTLVHENMQAGYHDITFNGSNLASGVYFYRITAGDFTDVKKMVLIK
jgi:hypothetical protein